MNQPPALDPEVGDLVVCPDERARAHRHLPADPGIVVGERSDQARVYYPTVPGDCWVPVQLLARLRHPAAARGVPPWLQRVWYLCKALRAVGLEVERFGPEGNAVRVYHGELELSLVDRIRADLGEELRYWAFHPAGLHKIESAVAFVTVDRAPPLPPDAEPQDP